MESKCIVLTVLCCDCGIEKKFSKYDIKRERHKNPRCRACGLKFYYANKQKQTKEEKQKYMKDYYQKNKKELNKYCSNWIANKRLLLINYFGGKCVHCGESDPIVLDFDHINNDGYIDKKNHKSNMVHLIERNPEKFQLLCKNCNWRKEYWKRKNNKE
jgi:hypothetical protein